MQLYAAIDLHARNNYLAIVTETGERRFKQKMSNHQEIILETLRPYNDSVAGIAVESTYNWYWLVDALMGGGYKVHLANPAAIQKYSGLKYSYDRHDAFWLAEMLRLNILPEGYIYPKEERPIRDLLRKRGHLVKLRTSLILSLQNIISRNLGINLDVNDVKRLKEDRVSPLLEENEDLLLAGKVSKDTIDYLTRKIWEIEAVVEKRVDLKKPYTYPRLNPSGTCLQTSPGVGKILALTIMLETGPISRFDEAGNYASYCRKVSSKWTSNDKSKGKGNKKNGNKYLAWAFSEAAELSRRFDAKIRAYYTRKMQKTNPRLKPSGTGFMVAHTRLPINLPRQRIIS